MPRTLPWLKGSGDSTASKARSTTSATPKRTTSPASKRRRISTPPPISDLDNDHDTAANTSNIGLTSPSKRRLQKPPRTPSTSPPPALPEHTLMRQGLAEDDIWIMVEDEFYTTAQAYTTHLHHAEYQRLKVLASERAKSAIAGSEGLGTDNGRSKLSAEGSRAVARAGREKSVNDMMRKAAQGGTEEEEDEGVDPWTGTQLAGLMDSPRKAQKLRATKLGIRRSETRAARGFGRSSQVEGDVARPRRVSFDDDDEDGEGGRVSTVSKPESPTRARKDWKRERKRQTGKDDFENELEDDDDDDLDMSARPTTRAKLSFEHFGRAAGTERESSVASGKLRPRSPSSHKPDVMERTERTEPGSDSAPPRSILRKEAVRDRIAGAGRVEKDPASLRQPTTRAEGFLARRRREREEERLRKQKDERRGSVGSVSAEIPTFLF